MFALSKRIFKLWIFLSFLTSNYLIWHCYSSKVFWHSYHSVWTLQKQDEISQIHISFIQRIKVFKINFNWLLVFHVKLQTNSMKHESFSSLIISRVWVIKILICILLLLLLMHSSLLFHFYCFLNQESLLFNQLLNSFFFFSFMLSFQQIYLAFV